MCSKSVRITPTVTTVEQLNQDFLFPLSGKRSALVNPKGVLGLPVSTLNVRVDSLHPRKWQAPVKWSGECADSVCGLTDICQQRLKLLAKVEAVSLRVDRGRFAVRTCASATSWKYMRGWTPCLFRLTRLLAVLISKRALPPIAQGVVNLAQVIAFFSRCLAACQGVAVGR